VVDVHTRSEVREMRGSEMLGVPLRKRRGDHGTIVAKYNVTFCCTGFLECNECNVYIVVKCFTVYDSYHQSLCSSYLAFHL